MRFFGGTREVPRSMRLSQYAARLGPGMSVSRQVVLQYAPIPTWSSVWVDSVIVSWLARITVPIGRSTVRAYAVARVRG